MIEVELSIYSVIAICVIALCLVLHEAMGYHMRKTYHLDKMSDDSGRKSILWSTWRTGFFSVMAISLLSLTPLIFGQKFGENLDITVFPAALTFFVVIMKSAFDAAKLAWYATFRDSYARAFSSSLKTVSIGLVASIMPVMSFWAFFG